MEGMLRPKATVLADSSLVPPHCTISPAPNQFTHEVKKQQAFYFSYKGSDTAPNGEFEAGVRVVLLVHHGGPMCRVVDGRGLYVETSFAGLRPRRSPHLSGRGR
jgi:hypothetical protein